MAFQPTTLVVLLATASLMSFGLGGYVFYRYLDRNRTLVVPFFGIALSGGWWSLTYALQLSSTTLQAKLFWNRLVWFGSAGLMIAWPAFVLVYTGLLALVASVVLALLYRTSSATIPVGHLPVVVALGIGVIVTPLCLFIAYVFRAATIARHTVSVGPFVPPESGTNGG